MAKREKSWLFSDVPVYKDGDGKKARWFVELKDGVTIEVKPVSGMVLFMLYRTYMAMMPDPPVVSMELEGVAAEQRMRDTQDIEYRQAVSKVWQELDSQIMQELMGGVVMPEGDGWAEAWVKRGRPLPEAGTPENDMIRTDLFLTLQGISSMDDRQMLIRAIDAISQETGGAIERAQEFFRFYMGRTEAEVSEAPGIESAHDAEGRDSGSDADLRDDGEAVVPSADRGTGYAAGIPAEQGDEGVPGRRKRQRSK